MLHEISNIKPQNIPIIEVNQTQKFSKKITQFIEESGRKAPDQKKISQTINDNMTENGLNAKQFTKSLLQSTNTNDIQQIFSIAEETNIPISEKITDQNSSSQNITQTTKKTKQEQTGNNTLIAQSHSGQKIPKNQILINTIVSMLKANRQKEAEQQLGNNTKLLESIIKSFQSIKKLSIEQIISFVNFIHNQLALIENSELKNKLKKELEKFLEAYSLEEFLNLSPEAQETTKTILSLSEKVQNLKEIPRELETVYTELLQQIGIPTN